MRAQRVTPSKGPPGETVCFKCGQKGHYKAKCNRMSIKPVLEPGVTNSSLVIGTLLDLLRNALVASHEPIAQSGRLLSEVNVPPKWTDVVKSAPASMAASAAPRAADRHHGDFAKPSCADCAKLYIRVEELEVVVRQLKMELARRKAGDGKSTMNPTAAPWVPQQPKPPEQVVEQKSIAEPARCEKQAGSALETGPSPVKSCVESQFSPVLPARSKRSLKRQRQNEAAAALREATAAGATEPSASVDKKAAQSGEQTEAKRAKAVRPETKTDQQSEEHRKWCVEHDALVQMVQEKPWSRETLIRLPNWGAITDKRRWNCVACAGGVDNPLCPQWFWEHWKK
jgi:hypothetical protein